MHTRSIGLIVGLFLSMGAAGAHADVLILESNVDGFEKGATKSEKDLADLKSKLQKGNRVRVLLPDNKTMLIEGPVEENRTTKTGGTRGMK